MVQEYREVINIPKHKEYGNLLRQLFVCHSHQNNVISTHSLMTNNNIYESTLYVNPLLPDGIYSCHEAPNLCWVASLIAMNG